MYLFPETPSMQQFMAWYNFLGQKMCSVARGQTDTHIDRHTHAKVNTEDTLSGFQEFFLQSIITDRSKNSVNLHFETIITFHGMACLCFLRHYTKIAMKLSILTAISHIIPHFKTYQLCHMLPSQFCYFFHI